MVQKFRDFLRQKKWQKIKKSDWVALALAGILLLIVAMPAGNDEKEKKAAADIAQNDGIAAAKTEEPENEVDDYVDGLEKKLEEILSQMNGVGKVKVMITASDAGEDVVEKDRTDTTNTVTETDSSGGNRTSTERQYSTSTVYIENERETYPFVGKKVLPAIEGVVVVAEGGDNSKVVTDIFEAVQALFPIEAHRVKVVKMAVSN